METRTPISFSDLLARPRQKADARTSYGPLPLQFGELWLPGGPGPHPVVAMIHGGCWRADLPGLELMDDISADLRGAGVAVWNIEYRRIGHDGGGYPGTFQDTARAIDHLRSLAPIFHLDLARVVTVGHSAGGHLAVWAAGRSGLPASNPLRGKRPLKIRAVVSLAGIVDLAGYRETGPDACGGPSTIDAITGAADRAGQDVFADTSPMAMAPIGVPQTVVSGDLDPIVPTRFGHAYGARAAGLGDTVAIYDMPGAGHFELIDSTSEAWPVIRAQIQASLD